MTAPKKKNRRGGSRPGRPLNAWQRSARFRVVALDALHKINSRRHLLTKCNATSKSTGLQCGNLPVHGQTKCRVHGGVTPRGDEWHMPRWPKPSDPKAMQKVHAKLADREKSAKERDRRLTSLPPALRQRYADWIRAHRPGSAAARRRDREYRRQDADARKLMAAVMARPRPAPSPEAQALAERIAELKAQLEVIGAEPDGHNETPGRPDGDADGADPGTDVNFKKGVFG